MASITRNHLYTVDMDKPLMRQNCGVLLAEGDNNGDCFRFSLMRSGVELVPGGAMSVTAYFIRQDGNTVFLTGESTGNHASVTLKQSCYIGEGRFSLVVKGSMDGVTVTIAVIDGYMKDTQSGELIDPGEVVPSLDELFAQIEAMEHATVEAIGAAEFANNSGQQAYLLAQQATVSLTMQVTEKLRRIAPPIINTATGDGVVLVSDSSENSFERLSIFGRTTQEGTPSPDNPAELVNIGTKGNIGLMVRGKNLLQNIATSGAWNGISFTVNEDGGVRLTGTATQLFALNITEAGFIPAGNYKLLPARAGAANRAYVDVIAGGVQVVQSQTAQTMPFTINEGDNAYARIIVPEGETIDAVLYPVIYSASVTDLGFEPFKDGGSITLIPPDEMRGIPVSVGGNYTDENGQQWICDEVDLARGVYVQRVAQIWMENLSQYSINQHGLVIGYNPSLTGKAKYDVGMCNSLVLKTADQQFSSAESCLSVRYSGPLVQIAGCKTLEELNASLATHAVIVLVALAEPIETPLTDDEMAAAMALKSLYPNTTIINDEGAGMAAAYVADTKNYIDQRIVALLNA